jgi:hypothetical protein
MSSFWLYAYLQAYSIYYWRILEVGLPIYTVINWAGIGWTPSDCFAVRGIFELALVI